MTGQTGHEDINSNDIWDWNNKDNLSCKFNFVDSQASGVSSSKVVLPMAKQLKSLPLATLILNVV